MRQILPLTLVLCGLFLGGICGKDEEGDEQVDQIVSQWVVPNNRVYPFMVYFTQFNRRLRKHVFSCAGTLIAPQKVLTSASCFEGIQSGVGFAPTSYTPIAWLASAEVGGPSAISRSVITVYKHPQYDPASNGNHDNIAVVLLQLEVLPTSATPAKLGYTLQPKVDVPNQLLAVGWGYAGGTISTKLLHSYMNLISDYDCQKVFGAVDNVNTICLAYPDAGACTYDLGSPILSNDQTQVIGVIGKNMRCGGGEPIVAVDIRRYRNWSPMPYQ
ncbi:hypothetical protein DAPPUDRAFT_302604 [Daphnia pulex]|uniref:Peptidase S1 domain-containing protein n=1 Tax=Daphnia pulex TaxID=6669 RepID=E9GDQ0_DAPPU|nr:hypothetical protein DAPPUDRAFT_302604 [Daphnia pulex]|eukprot:EFX82117.1 hypothetical protein DAPPUDRAFT_302604 [Daphnia pulex]